MNAESPRFPVKIEQIVFAASGLLTAFSIASEIRHRRKLAQEKRIALQGERRMNEGYEFSLNSGESGMVYNTPYSS